MDELCRQRGNNGEGKAVTDKEFAKYLFDFLWNESGADVCSKCEWCNACPNYGRKNYDTDLCVAGMREYAETTREA